MATDMLRGGSSLAHILKAGAWRSGAFLRYILRQDLDERVALEQVVGDSETE